MIMRLENSQNSPSLSTKSHPAPIIQVVSNHGDDVGPANFICQLTKRERCSMYCTCVCHRHSSFRSSRFLSYTFGLLFIGYNGSARLFKECDTKACRVRTTKKWHIFYMFPRWMLNRAVFISLCPQGPELLIRCLRTRQAETTPAFHSVARAQLNQIQSLMAIGQASVLDVDQFGMSLLLVSLLHIILSRDSFANMSNTPY